MKKKVFAFLSGTVFSLLLLEAFLWIFSLTVSYRHENTFSRDTSETVILCTGDSFTYGFGVPKGQDYASIMEQMLNNEFPERKFRVINEGVGGINSRFLVNNMETLLKKYQPDIVTVQIGGQNRVNFSGFDEGNSTTEKTLHFLENQSRVLRLLRMLRENIKDNREEYSSFLRLSVDRSLNMFEKIPEIMPEDIHIDSREAFCSVDYFRMRGSVFDEFRKGSIEVFLTSDEDKNHISLDEWKVCCISLFVQGKLDQAIEKMTEAEKKYDDPFFPVCKAFCFLEKQKISQAFRIFKEKLKENPHDSAIYIGLGIVYQYLEKEELSLRWFLKALEIDPLNPWAYSLAGGVYFDRRDFETAEKYYLEGMNRCPEFSENYSGLGEIYQTLGDLDKAEKIFKTALEKTVIFYWEKSEIYRMLSRLIMDRDRDRDKAVSYLYDSFRIDPGNTVTLSDFGWLSPTEEEYQKVLEIYRSAGNEKGCSLIENLLSNKFSSERIFSWLYQDLEEILSLCVRYRAKVYFLNYPENENPAMLELCKKNNQIMIDLFSEFNHLWQQGKNRDEYFLPDRHCNKKGNYETSRIIMSYLRKENLHLP